MTATDTQAEALAELAAYHLDSMTKTGGATAKAGVVKLWIGDEGINLSNVTTDYDITVYECGPAAAYETPDTHSVDGYGAFMSFEVHGLNDGYEGFAIPVFRSGKRGAELRPVTALPDEIRQAAADSGLYRDQFVTAVHDDGYAEYPLDADYTLVTDWEGDGTFNPNVTADPASGTDRQHVDDLLCDLDWFHCEGVEWSDSNEVFYPIAASVET